MDRQEAVESILETYSYDDINVKAEEDSISTTYTFDGEEYGLEIHNTIDDEEVFLMIVNNAIQGVHEQIISDVTGLDVHL